MKRKRDAAVRAILDISKRCATDMKGFAETTDFAVNWTSFSEWERAFVQINKAVVELEKRMLLREQQHETELHLLREAMRNELIDREGNSARVAEKQRLLWERLYGSSGSHVAMLDMVPRGVNAVEQALSQVSAVGASSSGRADWIAQ